MLVLVGCVTEVDAFPDVVGVKELPVVLVEVTIPVDVVDDASVLDDVVSEDVVVEDVVVEYVVVEESVEVLLADCAVVELVELAELDEDVELAEVVEVDVDVAVAVTPMVMVPETVPEAFTVDVNSCPAATITVDVT